ARGLESDWEGRTTACEHGRVRKDLGGIEAGREAAGMQLVHPPALAYPGRPGNVYRARAARASSRRSEGYRRPAVSVGAGAVSRRSRGAGDFRWTPTAGRAFR